MREFSHTPNYCAWAKQDLVRITPTNSIYFSNSFTCFSITFEWTQCCPVNTVQCCSMRSAQLVQNSGLLLQPFPSLVDWPVDVVAFYFPWYVTCPPEWLQFLSSPNWMHRPPHQAGWGEIELWSAVPEIALMISSRRDQGLLEGYCTGGLMREWGLLWGSERRFWITMIKPSFVFHHAPLKETLMWVEKKMPLRTYFFLMNGEGKVHPKLEVLSLFTSSHVF